MANVKRNTWHTIISEEPGQESKTYNFRSEERHRDGWDIAAAIKRKFPEEKNTTMWKLIKNTYTPGAPDVEVKLINKRYATM